MRIRTAAKISIVVTHSDKDASNVQLISLGSQGIQFPNNQEIWCNQTCAQNAGVW